MATEPEAEPTKKKLPIVKILIGVVGALALVAIGAGAAILYAKLTKPPEENPLAIVIEKKSDDAKSDAASKGEAGEKGKTADKEPSASGKPVPSREQYVTSYFEFPGNFTTNMKGSRRFVQMAIGLATQYDKRVIENVQKHEVAIRSEVLSVLADQTEADLVGVDNRRRIQGLIKDAINRVLIERTEFGGIENVFITALVMQ
ncbi:MAG: flagellar basal body-associated FliL family protein [Beijerinckiaceae bacterium]|jgi:flagellar FliL protein